MKKINGVDSNAIVSIYRNNVIKPLLGDGEVSDRLLKGLHKVLGDSENLSLPISEAFRKKRTLHVRAVGVLKKLGAPMLADATQVTAGDILEYENVGLGTVKYIKEELGRYGLSLKDDNPH